MRSGYDTEEIKRVSDIRNRWYGNYYLTNDQYEDIMRCFENEFEDARVRVSPKTFTTYATLSDIVVKHKGLGFRNIKIKRIIFNPPATVIIWEDDTKTVVKCSEDDEFNPEIGVAMCYMKKIYGSRHAFSKMVEKYEID